MRDERGWRFRCLQPLSVTAGGDDTIDDTSLNDAHSRNKKCVFNASGQRESMEQGRYHLPVSDTARLGGLSDLDD